MPPHSLSPMHRTVSLDYGIRMLPSTLLAYHAFTVTLFITRSERTVVKGSKLVLHLDEGRKSEIRNGDIVGMYSHSLLLYAHHMVNIFDGRLFSFGSAKRDYPCMGKPNR